MRENVLIYGLVAVIFALAAVGMYVEWSLGWLDWIEDRQSFRSRQFWRTGVFIANVVAAGAVVMIPVQLFAPDGKKASAE